MTYDYNLSAEERDILEMVDRNELRPIPNAEQEKEYAQQAARNTLKKIKRGQRAKDTQSEPITKISVISGSKTPSLQRKRAGGMFSVLN